jgi:formamidopyrimidine-DNA glycosylase
VTYLPEVEVIRKELEKEVQGKRFKDINVKSANAVARHRNRPEFYKLLDGRKIESLTRRGRLLLFELDEDQTLVVSLGTRGVLSRETANVEAGPDTQFTASFTTGGALHLVDPAKDGELFVVPTAELEGIPELSTGGIDALADTFTGHKSWFYVRNCWDTCCATSHSSSASATCTPTRSSGPRDCRGCESRTR